MTDLESTRIIPSVNESAPTPTSAGSSCSTEPDLPSLKEPPRTSSFSGIRSIRKSKHDQAKTFGAT